MKRKSKLCAIEEKVFDFLKSMIEVFDFSGFYRLQRLTKASRFRPKILQKSSEHLSFVTNVRNFFKRNTRV
jgi:hypothetical protein